MVKNLILALATTIILLAIATYYLISLRNMAFDALDDAKASNEMARNAVDLSNDLESKLETAESSLKLALDRIDTLKAQLGIEKINAEAFYGSGNNWVRIDNY